MMRYRVVAHPDLRILHFGDESVVFNPVLWQTHLLNPAASLILEALEAGEATADDVAAALLDDAGGATVPSSEVARVLDDLAALGVVEAAA